MKTLIISIIALTVISSQNSLATTTTMYAKRVNAAFQDSSKQSIQTQIMDAFMSSFVEQNNSKMTSLINELASSYKESENSLFLYWEGYALYYNCIISLKNSDRESAHTELTKAIKTLESIERKNSEDYALLSMLESFSCQFLGFPEVIQASKNATTYIERAIELDENNLRAYYVLANNDYYTPDNYGGGKNVEKYALKAISLPAQKVNNPYLPSWGRQESYELITNHYIKQKDTEKAKKYVEQGLNEYPNSYVLKSNEAKLSR